MKKLTVEKNFSNNCFSLRTAHLNVKLRTHTYFETHLCRNLKKKGKYEEKGNVTNVIFLR